MIEKPLPKFAVVCGAGRLCEGYTYPEGNTYMEAQDGHAIRSRTVGSRKMSQKKVTERLNDCFRCLSEKGRLCDVNEGNSLLPQDIGVQTGSKVFYFDNTPKNKRHIELAAGKVGVEFKFDINGPKNSELAVMIYHCTPESETNFQRLKELYTRTDI